MAQKIPITLRSKPDAIHTWAATVTYTPSIYKITINRSPGDTATYSLALTKDWKAVVALYGNNTDVGLGFTVEGLGQNIMAFMLTG